MKISIEIEDNKQLDRFISLVNEWEKVNKNKIVIKSLKIRFKYHMKSAGEFEHWKPNCLNINPKKCDKKGEWDFENILIHEFSHLLDNKFKMVDGFKKEFTDKNIRLYLTTYAKECHDPIEELAEIISMYLKNPYLLMLISEPHYLFVTKYFKSPTPCTEEYFYGVWDSYSDRHKLALIKRYNLILK